jgi:hypothetical protein
MMYVISLFFILFTTLAARAATPGLSLGNQFYATPLQGVVTVYCGTSSPVTYTCYDTVLDPSSYDYFIGPQGVRADQVSLSCLRQDGSRRERTEDYDAKNRHSLRAYNLWINTPFQRPLLAIGVNKIDYKMMSTGKIIEQGTFSVNVTHGHLRTCPPTHYNSKDPSDCESPYTACQRYFEQYDYCR